MNKDRLQYLLAREKEGTCSDEERVALEAWYSAGEEQPDFTHTLTQNALDALETSLFAKIEHALDQEKTAESKPLRSHPFAGMLRIAASVLLFVLSGIGVYYYFSRASMVTEQTAFGEMRKVVLPDGSEVTLNGNSEITYLSDWENGKIREVNLKGEAYFKVIHTKDHRKFRVRTGRDFSLDVLGTEFDVASRKSGTRVILDKGKVQCNLNGKGNNSLILKPGEMVQFAHNPAEYVRKNVEVSAYSAWKEHKLVFKNTSLKEISVILEETYNLRTETENPELLTREITGSVPTDHIEILLEGIAEASGVTIQQKDDKLIITDRKN